ncbi:MAG TPA: hypothetical protein VFA04_25275 [Bryobacteraceae bacterium]|nr:hypothetical protein [Bryobacteraceae bacterium]
MKIAAGIVCAGLAVALCGCHRDIQNPEAVRQGVLRYLAKRQDLGAMDVSISSVSFRSDEADAVVHFQSKSNNARNAGLDIKYILTRSGNEWVVKGRSGMGASGANPHGDMGAGGANPHGDMGGAGAAPALPPGHPAIPNK